MKLHIGKEGDTLYSLSDKYGVEPERILEANPQLKETGQITRGIKVRIPSGPVVMHQNFRSSGGTREESKPKPEPTQQAAEPQPMQPTVTMQSKPPTQEALSVEQAVQPKPAPSKPEPNPPAAAASQAPSAMPLYPLEMPETKPLGSFDFSTMANKPFEPQVMATTQPAYYKTEIGEAAQSPLHVKWSGMNDTAVHPFAQSSSPAVPAGAGYPTAYPTAYPTSYNYPYPAPTPPGQTPYSTAYLPNTFGMMSYPAVPEPYMPQYPYVPFAASGDCGCGGPKLDLPYAMPKRSADEREAAPDASRASVSGSPVQEQATSKKPADSKGKTSSKKVKISSRSDAVKEFVKKANQRPQRTRRGSTPWVND